MVSVPSSSLIQVTFDPSAPQSPDMASVCSDPALSRSSVVAYASSEKIAVSNKKTKLTT